MSGEQLKQKTARGLLWGGIGQGGMQLLNLVFGIFLSRLLSPSDYGTVGALTVFSAVAQIFTESGFTLAIVNRREVTDRDYSSVFWFNIVVGAVLYAALFFLAEPIASFYRDPSMVPLARFLFLSFFIGATATAPSAYMFRNLMVKERSRILLAAIVVSGVAGVVCAMHGMGYWGIAVQTVLFSITTTVLYWTAVPWRPSRCFSIASIRSMLPFSSRQMAVSLFTHFNNNFFAMLLARFYTLQQTGYYTQGNKWTTMGFSTISGMINSVGQPVMRQVRDEAAGSGHDGHERLRRVFRKMLRFAAFTSFPAMLGLGLIAREVIVLSVTAKWLPAVEVMQILCIGGAFLPLATLYGNLFNSLGRPSVYMWNTIALGLTQIALAVISYPYGLRVMLWAYTGANVAWLAVWQFFARRAIGLRARSVLLDVLPYLTSAVAAVAAGRCAALAATGIVTSLIFKVAGAAAAYCLILWLSGSVVFRETIQYFTKR
ncbi:MAG: lipopolysaccharide biosynthesis protein [Muribaculaceae bacterium]|nr:lipopolysaccharide biosynthesis protein [Muribaculaceae bacterium]